MTIHIRTNRETYRVRESDGAITRAACDWEFSGKWLLRGMRRTNNFGNTIEFRRLEEIVSNPSVLGEMTYKNGKPRWRVLDLDHGGLREWGEQPYSVYKAT